MSQLEHLIVNVFIMLLSLVQWPFIFNIVHAHKHDKACVVAAISLMFSGGMAVIETILIMSVFLMHTKKH